MRIDSAYIGDLAAKTRFDPLNLEKVLRLKQLLVELRRHPFLRDKLVLKGGTAINLFYLDLARLSVDIDLNYIGQADREAMQRERPDIDRAVSQICQGLGYKIQRGTDEYALLELYLGFANHAGRQDRVQIEINFVMRVCCLPPVLLKATRLGDEEACEFPVLAPEELVGSKLKVMIERAHPRDLYDLYRGEAKPLEHDAELARKFAVLFGSTLDRDLRDYSLDRYTEISQSELDRHLYPLLRSDDRPKGGEMLGKVRPKLAAVLDHEREQRFLEAMAQAKYDPTLLFPDHPEIVARIVNHPALLWKTENVAKYLARRKGDR